MKRIMKRIIINKNNIKICCILGILILLFLLSFVLGRYDVPIHEVVKILINQIIPLNNSWTSNMQTAVLNIRLPRILLACLVGCSLSAAGAAFQSVFHNPMASPDILGASSGACFGAALAILFDMSKFSITVFAFISGLFTVLLVYTLGSRAKGNNTVNLLLSGMMVSSLFSAATSYIKLAADPSDQLPAITYWIMGSLSGTRLSDISFVIIPMAIGLIPLFLLRWRINLLTIGEDEAQSMGINIKLLRAIVIMCATFITAAAVSVSGMIGWVGLVVPHLCRKIIGNNCTYLIPSSMLLGALFLLFVDNISRCLIQSEIPIGILTSFVGAPFFIYLMLRKEK